MVSELGDVDGAPLSPVYDAVFLGDAAQPVTGKGVAKRLRLADPFKGKPADFLEEDVDPLQNLPVRFLPVEILPPRVIGEDVAHPASLRFTPFPSSICWIDSRSLRALRGDLSRCDVATSDS